MPLLQNTGLLKSPEQSGSRRDARNLYQYASEINRTIDEVRNWDREFCLSHKFSGYKQ